jgi:hypothetical protein
LFGGGRMSYVGYRTIASVEELKRLIGQYAGDTAGYFLRWSHRVSGIVSQLPDDFAQAEGQVFNPQLELRWKRAGQGYSVLLLSQDDGIVESGFMPLAGTWQVQIHGALTHDPRNPQYPKPFKYEGVDRQSIRQCYFRNADTGNVHFIALTLRSPEPQTSAA